MQATPNPVLIFTWGNPSRGDDAIGPRLHDRLQAADLPGVDLLTDFQLQIEHALDLENRDRILFIDASASAPPPFEFCELQPDRDNSYTTHAMSPGALLHVYTQVNAQRPPPSFMLTVRGYEFGLGLPVSGKALRNTARAYDFIIDLLATEGSQWSQRTQSACLSAGINRR
jgi:hydrogenase maturation protease